MAQTKSDSSVNMEISNGSVVHCPVGSCLEMEDRRTGEEEEEDEVELAEEVDENIHIVGEDGAGDDAMTSNVNQTEQENDLMDDTEEETKPGSEREVTQNELTREIRSEGEVEEDRITEVEIEDESSTTAQSQPHAIEELEEVFKGVIEDQPEHVSGTPHEDEKTAENIHVQTVSEGHKVRGVTFNLISDEQEHASSVSGDDETQLVETESIEERKEEEDVNEVSSHEVEELPSLSNDDEGAMIEEEPVPVDEEPGIFSTIQEESKEDLQSEEQEPETKEMQFEEQAMNEVFLEEDIHNDHSQIQNNDVSEIDFITAEEPSEVLIDHDEKLQNSDQLAVENADVAVIPDEGGRLEQVAENSSMMDEVETHQQTDESSERTVADTQPAPEETGGHREADEEPKREVKVIEEPPVEEGGREEPEQPQETVGVNNDKQEVVEEANFATEQPKHVNKELTSSLEEGVRQGKEEVRAVIEDMLKKKAREGGRKVTIPAWLKARETLDVQEPPRPLSGHWRDTSGKVEGQVTVKAKGQEVTIENGVSGISASLVQQEKEKMVIKTRTTAQQMDKDVCSADPSDMKVSLYVKVMSKVQVVFYYCILQDDGSLVVFKVSVEC